MLVINRIFLLLLSKYIYPHYVKGHPLMNKFTVLSILTLSYLYGIVYNRSYYKLNIEGWYSLEKLPFGLFRSLFLLISWFALYITYNQSTNSVLSYFLFIFPLFIEMGEDCMLLAKSKKEGKKIPKGIIFITLIGLLLIGLGITFNFLALINIEILRMPEILTYIFVSMFIGIVWIIGKVVCFAYYSTKE